VDGITLPGEETASRELIDDVESTRNTLATVFGLESGDGDAVVEAEAEEPGFFMLTIGREPCGFARLQGFEIGVKVVGGGEAKEMAGLAWSGRRGGFAQHRRRIESEAEVGTVLPVAEIVARLVARSGEVGDLVLGQARGGEGFDGELVHAGDGVVVGNYGCVVTGAAGEEFPAEPGFVVNFEHVDAGVGDAGSGESGDGFLPGSEGLAGKAGDEVEVDVGDSGGAQPGEVVEDDGAAVKAAGLAGFPVDKGLDAEADAVDAGADESGKGSIRQLAGGALDGDFGA